MDDYKLYCDQCHERKPATQADGEATLFICVECTQWNACNDLIWPANDQYVCIP
jgi:hypothetical protein